MMLAMTFCGGIYYFLGHQKALEFMGGYLIELSLSMDNLFVSEQSSPVSAFGNMPSIGYWATASQARSFCGSSLSSSAFIWSAVLNGFCICSAEFSLSTDSKC